jgi:RNA recognition motif-containing protein
MNEYFIILSIAINIMLTIVVVLFYLKLKAIEKKHIDFISKFDENTNIEDTLKDYIQFVNNVNEENKIIKANSINLEKRVNKTLQKVGIVRYNAFEDVGSELSFALAILDNENNGFVINSIYSRNSSNVYAKPIESGTSKYTLSEEEIQAVSKAKEQ